MIPALPVGSGIVHRTCDGLDAIVVRGVAVSSFDTGVVDASLAPGRTAHRRSAGDPSERSGKARHTRVVLPPSFDASGDDPTDVFMAPTTKKGSSYRRTRGGSCQDTDRLMTEP